MFAEFELRMGELNTQGVPLTAELLCAEYKALNANISTPAPRSRSMGSWEQPPDRKPSISFTAGAPSFKVQGSQRQILWPGHGDG
mgnify:CR=1 FL=1